MSNILLYVLAAFCFLYGTWFILVGSHYVAAGRSSPARLVDFDDNKIANSLMTGAFWTISEGILFLLHPNLFVPVLTCIPFLPDVLIQSSGLKSDGKIPVIPILIIALINGALAYVIRSIVRTQTKLTVDLPPEVIEEWENQDPEHHHIE